jgi:hypothetical protein
MSEAFRIPEIANRRVAESIANSLRPRSVQLSPQEMQALLSGQVPAFTPGQQNMLGSLNPQAQLQLTPEAERGRIFSEAFQPDNVASALLGLIGINQLRGKQLSKPAPTPPSTRPRPQPPQAPQLPTEEVPTGPAFAPVPGLQVPTLPPLQEAAPADFSKAIAALGQPVQPQEIGRGERVSRTFGGLAAGGLQAIQGAPQGRAATLGEVLAGVGAGGAAERSALEAETRQLQAAAEAQNFQRRRDLSNLRTVETATEAARSQATAEAHNQRSLLETQLKLDVDQFNIEQTRPVSVPGGYVIPATGEFVSTANKLGDTIEVIKWLQEVQEKAGEQMVHTAAGELIINNIPENMQLPTAAAIQASTNDEAVRLAAEVLRRQNRETEAANVLMLHEGSEAGMTKEQILKAEGALVDILSTMIFDNWTSEMQGKPVPFETLNHRLWLSQAKANPQLRTTAGQQALIAGALGR